MCVTRKFDLDLLRLTQTGRLAGGKVEAVLWQAGTGSWGLALCVRRRRGWNGRLGSCPAPLAVQLQTIILRLQLLNLHLCKKIIRWGNNKNNLVNYSYVEGILQTCMRFMASRSWSSWCAELRASRRISVSFISFSLSSLRSCITVSASLSKHSDNLGNHKPWWSTKGWTFTGTTAVHHQTYSVLECVPLRRWLGAEVPLWGSLGEDGRDESVISSISEWDEADLGDFFLVKACLKELRSCKGTNIWKVRRGGWSVTVRGRGECAGENGCRQT